MSKAERRDPKMGDDDNHLLACWRERRLEAARVTVMRESQALADRRGVRALMSFADPLGNRLEAFHDVGQGYDLAQGVPDRVATTPGRHTNDFVTSFYAKTPAGFLFEYGWGGREVDDAIWQVEEMTDGPSLWGHERTWLPEAQNKQARALRAAVAAKGQAGAGAGDGRQPPAPGGCLFVVACGAAIRMIPGLNR